MTIFVLICLATAVVSVATGILIDDVVIKRIHRDYPDLWQQLGKPVGYFWSPPEATRKEVWDFWLRRIDIFKALRRSAHPRRDELLGGRMLKQMKARQASRLIYYLSILALLGRIIALFLL